MKQLLSAIAISGMMMSASTLYAIDGIESVAPEDTIILLGTRNAQTLCGDLDETGIMQALEGDQFRGLLEAAMGLSLEEAMENVHQTLEEIGVKDGEIVWPTGAAGIAFFMGEQEDTGMSVPGILLVGDFGDRADDFQEFTTSIFNHGAEEGEVDLEESELFGRTVWSISDPDAEDGDDFDDEFGGDPLGMEEEMKSLHLVRDGSTFMLCSNFGQLAEILTGLDGDAGSVLTSRDDYTGAMDAVGESDVYGAVLIKGLFDMVSNVEPGAAMMRPMVTRFVGDIRSIGIGMDLQGDAAMFEQTLSVYMPDGKEGLSNVFDVPQERGALPSIVGPDTASFSRVNLGFDRFMELAKSIMAMAGPMMGAGGDGVAQMEEMLAPLMHPLDGSMFVVSDVSYPIDASSVSAITALGCKDGKAFENALGAMAPMMGLEPRDFNGRRIFAMDAMTAGMMMGGMGGGGPEDGMAIGIGGEYIYIGGNGAVENAMRNAGDDSVQGSGRFASAISCLKGGAVVAWGFGDTITMAEAKMVAEKQSLLASIEEMREFDEEFAAEMEAEMAPFIKMLENFDVSELRQLFGPTAWEVRSTDQGFVFNGYQVAGSIDE